MSGFNITTLILAHVLSINEPGPLVYMYTLYRGHGRVTGQRTLRVSLSGNVRFKHNIDH